MTKTGFVIANLFRKKTRTTLTLLSVIMAFLLFGLLQSVNHIFSAGPNFLGAARLMTQARVSFTQPLPISMVPKLEAIPGVTRVAYSQWFGGIWQENTPLFVFAVDPQRHHDAYPEWMMPEDQWTAFKTTRTGMVAGKLIADKYGWKVGQKIPISSNIFPQKNGSKAWAFDLVGIFDGKDDDWKKRALNVYINYAYFNEANQFIKVERNPNYWRPGRPYLDGIEYTILKSVATATMGFTSGTFDLMFPYNVTIPIMKDIKRQMPSAVCEVTPGPVNRHLLINHAIPPFDVCI